MASIPQFGLVLRTLSPQEIGMTKYKRVVDGEPSERLRTVLREAVSGSSRRFAVGHQVQPLAGWPALRFYMHDAVFDHGSSAQKHLIDLSENGEHATNRTRSGAG